MVWGTHGGWATIITGIILFGGLGLLQEKFESHLEYQRIKEAERERLHRSDLKKRARKELIQEEFPELRSQSSTQQRQSIPTHLQEAVYNRY